MPQKYYHPTNYGTYLDKVMLSNIAVDPRCPYCGRPVIGSYVQGLEGKYHPQCTQPPEPQKKEDQPPQTGIAYTSPTLT